MPQLEDGYGPRTVVCVVDGKEEVRLLDYVEWVDGLFRYPRSVPVLREGEVIEWLIADDRPYVRRK